MSKLYVYNVYYRELEAEKPFGGYGCRGEVPEIKVVDTAVQHSVASGDGTQATWRASMIVSEDNGHFTIIKSRYDNREGETLDKDSAVLLLDPHPLIRYIGKLSHSD